MHTLRSMLSRPFGPYLDEDILICFGAYKNPKTNVLERKLRVPQWSLESLQLTENGEYIGLDKYQMWPEGEEHRVLFRGVFRLRDIKHLSDEGKRLLSQELLNRGVQKNLDYCIREQKVQILIQGSLSFPPRYMTNKSTILILFTGSSQLEKKSDLRSYVVYSMHAATYYASRKFLSDYHVLHEVEKICHHDNEFKLHATKIEDRSPSWLVTRYLYMYNEKPNPGVHKRHVHRSEIYHLLGKHAFWLLDIFRRKKIVNVQLWKEFCSEVKGRKQARTNGLSAEEINERWGRGECNPADNPPEHAPLPSRAGTPGVSHHEQEGDDWPQYDDAIGWGGTFTIRAYSEPTMSDEETASEEDSNLDALHCIPGQLYIQPEIPRNFVWDCPIDSCPYSVALRDLTDENLEGVNADDQIYLKSKRWTLQDERFQDLFYDMVERHFINHMKDIGIALFAQPPHERFFEVDRYVELPKDTKLTVRKVKKQRL